MIPWITITLGKAWAADAVLHHVEQLVLLPHSLHDLGQIIADLSPLTSSGFWYENFNYFAMKWEMWDVRSVYISLDLNTRRILMEPIYFPQSTMNEPALSFGMPKLSHIFIFILE